MKLQLVDQNGTVYVEAEDDVEFAPVRLEPGWYWVKPAAVPYNPSPSVPPITVPKPLFIMSIRCNPAPTSIHTRPIPSWCE